MKNKGFTLLELLGVVIILGALSLITFPIILNQIKNAKQGIKDSTKALIIDAAKDYYEDNSNNYDRVEGMTYCIDIETLTDENYLNKNLKDENLNNMDTSEKVKMFYHNDKFNYEVVDKCTNYTVTFDANGGTVGVESKKVTQDSVYGTLPTPTREGYTFMGWNGKNMLNVDDATNGCLIDNGDGTYTMWYNNICRLSEKINISIEANRTIVMSYDLIEYNGTYRIPLQIFGKYINIDFFYLDFIDNTETTKNVGKKYITQDVSNLTIYQEGSQPVGTYTKFTNLQLEVGDTATEYEPYYVTSKTKVTRNYDHTLKAIWKENE